MVKTPLWCRRFEVRFSGQSNRTKSPTARHRCDVLPNCVAQAIRCGDGPTTRYMLRRNAVSAKDLILIFFFLTIIHKIVTKLTCLICFCLKNANVPCNQSHCGLILTVAGADSPSHSLCRECSHSNHPNSRQSETHHYQLRSNKD